MKIYFLLPLALLLSCRCVKNFNKNQSYEKQLFKDVEVLSSDAFEGRKTGTKGSEKARNYIEKRFKSIGVLPFSSFPKYEQSFNFKDNSGNALTGKNVIGYIQGKTDEAIVISAHYDHLGIINNEIYNGADDNASGVAGLLKIAAYYAKSKPNNTLIFAAFDAGEQEWKGSRAFVAGPPVKLSSIFLNINLDMISHNDQNILYAAGTFKHPELRNYVIYTNPELKILFGHDNPKISSDDWTNQSDQGAFNAVNIPFLYFGVEDHNDYHKSTDKFQNINKTFFISAANAILEVVDHIDKKKDVNAIFREKVIMKK
ncbi:M28 family peptidase [Pedobacter nutrimenti]|jgi:Zn-dependent M28 family amino/carboxypeptidase|uniref:Peptidase M28-like protein n=1 Tax=Pedobacter nutrimenti TaxID=1241337 RepID=A0A318UAT9_9SPHI|nr:M28 family peptidase [Pedobacter nutrimenti]PYF72685.1 peptidase M28-like protein [Pedobacter nutrimenti]